MYKNEIRHLKMMVNPRTDACNLISSFSLKNERKNDPVLAFTVFVPDEKKADGSYEKITHTVRMVVTEERTIILISKTVISGMNRTIDFDRIIGIKGELVNYLDNTIE